MSGLRVIIAAHKPYRVCEDPLYLPVHVGREGKEGFGFQGDNTGDHISEKNSTYCELTGLYWAWKNLPDIDLGLVHYRRYLLRKHGKTREDILTEKEAQAYLLEAPVLLPKPRHYWIETNYSQYAHAHHARDLDVMREILKEKHPDQVAVYDAWMKKTWGHRFNMFIMKREVLDAYCEWLFDLLFELERRLDISGYSANDRRVFGFVSERLLDVWLSANGVRYLELPHIFLEKQNWLVKGWNFLRRKFIGKKDG